MKPVLAAALSFLALGAQEIVPAPLRLERRSGAFELTASTRIVAEGPAAAIGEALARDLRPATGLALPVTGKAGKDAIILELRKDASLGDEGYRLESAPGKVTLVAARPAGLFYATQTLRQMLPSDNFRSARVDGVAWTVPAATIEDRPRFAWRGSQMDVGRHFMSKSVIKKHLDLMALHKLNVFHWHLTEDQGWRIEIHKYPKLTQVGAWRRETVHGETLNDERPNLMRFDNTPCGGFYTQEDVKEIVRYAADRFITVVPEIEMPGHSQAAISAYPALGNFPDIQHEPLTYWGVSPVVFSTDDSTLAFLKDVLDEVMALFPSRFIHVGGDECPKDEWARSPQALARMKRLGLVPASTTQADILNYKDEKGQPAVHPALHQLQSWFVQQFDAYLASKGRRLIGWDEILEGGLAPGAAVMSWRGEKGGIEAARAGHDVVMTPGEWTYLDHYNTSGPEPLAIGGDVVSLAKAYGYDPVPAGLTPGESSHVLGSEGLIWTEYVPTPAHLEYMLWPRLSALSEVFWSPKEGRDFKEFQQRLKEHAKRLDALDVNRWRPQEERAKFKERP
jgi:hexosaminidase